MTGGSPQTTSPTRGFNVKSMVFNGVDLNAFDIGGQQSLRIYWANYYPKTNGIVWVIDSTDRRRMFETGLELVALLKEPKLEGKPLLILANKQDLATAMIASEISNELELHQIRNRNWHIQDCSAITGYGLQEGMEWMVQNLVSREKSQNLRKELTIANNKPPKEHENTPSKNKLLFKSKERENKKQKETKKQETNEKKAGKFSMFKRGKSPKKQKKEETNTKENEIKLDQEESSSKDNEPGNNNENEKDVKKEKKSLFKRGKSPKKQKKETNAGKEDTKKEKTSLFKRGKSPMKQKKEVGAGKEGNEDEGTKKGKTSLFKRGKSPKKQKKEGDSRKEENNDKEAEEENKDKETEEENKDKQEDKHEAKDEKQEIGDQSESK